MPKLKKCQLCKGYTIEDICLKCKKETKDAHYKHIKFKEIKSE